MRRERDVNRNGLGCWVENVGRTNGPERRQRALGRSPSNGPCGSGPAYAVKVINPIPDFPGAERQADRHGEPSALFNSIFFVLYSFFSQNPHFRRLLFQFFFILLTEDALLLFLSPELNTANWRSSRSAGGLRSIPRIFRRRRQKRVTARVWSLSQTDGPRRSRITL